MRKSKTVCFFYLVTLPGISFGSRPAVAWLGLGTSSPVSSGEETRFRCSILGREQSSLLAYGHGNKNGPLISGLIFVKP
jgi:hypothetical protein